MLVSVVRYILCSYTTNKKYMYLFLLINTIIFLLTFHELADVLIYLALVFIIVGNFQKDKKLMRQLMMIGTLILIVYNSIILSPMAILLELNLFISHIIGYYRHYIRT